MAKFLITQDIADAGEVKKFTFRIRDMYEKYTTEVTVKASSVQEAKQKVKAQLIGWANFVIMRVWDETGATYYGRDLINFKDNQTVVEDGVYNIFANENDKDYLKSALKEMNRYLDSWEQLSMKMRRDIAPGGKSELKEHIKNAQARLAQLNDSQTVKDYGEFENIEFDSSNDNLATNEVLFKYSEFHGVQKRNINGLTELNFGGDWYKAVHTRVVPIGGGAKYFIRMQKIKDSKLNDDWSGSYNGAIYNYDNGQWTITHKNGTVETIPGDKFDKIEEVYAYIDNFRDSNITCEGESTISDSVEITKESGTDKIVYVMQSDVDKNLYFYIGQNYAMKDGEWTYAKFKMNGTTPEQLKSELEKVGWHQVNNGPANIIDSKEGFENYLDVYDANYSEDVNHTADYLWTWTHNGREEVASKLFDEQLYKYNTKEEAIQHIDEIYKNARKEFEDFYRQLKVVVNKRLEDGYKMNLQALEQRRNRLKK